MSDTLRFEIARPDDLAPIAAMWRELQSRAEHPFFLDWAWIGAWLAEAGREALILTGSAGGRVVLLGALMPGVRRDVLPVHGLHLHQVGDDAYDVITMEYNGFLVDPGWAGRAEAAAIDFLLDGRAIAGRRRDELYLRGISGPFDPAALRRDLTCVIVSRQPSWQVDLAGLRAAGRPYLDGLSANTRYQIRRAIRLYAARGPVVAERAGDVAEGLAFLDGLKALHQRYWRGRGELGAFGFPFFERFQRRLIADLLPVGAVELLRVRAGADEIGYLYNFMHQGRVLAYQSGFNYEADPRLKPGLVSHALAIARHLEEGAACYDFMAGDARYKASLGAPGPHMDYWRVERPTLMLRLENLLRLGFRRATG